ncbi:MAG TPA: maleylpyruvate isomerase family mycothiol-dependent enzyme, partial [Actinomycetota bacterium]|nr:maleylpyruvate isomerase family mycothiol-dependent enzyme [Actinomycetota bacterium]
MVASARSSVSMLEALDRARPRFTDLLRAVDDPTRPAIGIWTIRDVAAHVATNWEAYGEFLAGRGPRLDDIFDHPQAMDEMAKAEPEQDVRVLADRIDAATTAWIDAARELDPNQRVPWYTGDSIPITVRVLAAFQLGDFLLHGYDVARAEGRPWKLPKDEAALVL